MFSTKCVYNHNMQKKEAFPLLVILSLAALLGAAMLTRGHVWPDDFAAYIMQARSIVTGDMPGFIVHNTITIKSSSSQLGPIAYPWGFPLLLAPVYRILGISPLGFKLVGLAFFLAFLIVFYLLLRRRFSPTIGLLTVSLFAFNLTLLRFLDYILSDIPFLFACTLTVLLIDKYATEQVRGLRFPILIGLALFAGFFLRTPGILLLFTFLAYQIWRVFLDRALTKSLALDALVAVLVFGLLWLISSVIFPGGQDSYFSHFEEYGFGAESVLRNAKGYFLVLGTFFEGLPGYQIIFWVFVGLALLGAAVRLKADMLFLLAGLPFYVTNALWPEWQGLRFMFPALPFFVYFAVQGLQALAGRKHVLVYTALVVLITGLLLSSSGAAWANLRNGRQINGPFDPYSLALYAFLEDETPPESVIVFFRPRALRLMVDRDAISITQCAQLRRGDFIALSKKVGDNLQIPPEEIEACGLPLAQVYQNRRFVVFEIRD
ncbi:MAG: hypothetical protein Kow002_08050 [Anaerolineales bacterium]